MEQHDLEKTLAVLLKKRDQARELGVSSVPELDIQILNLEKEILLKTWQKKYDDLLADFKEAFGLYNAEKAKNEKLVSKFKESGGNNFTQEREAWKKEVKRLNDFIKELNEKTPIIQQEWKDELLMLREKVQRLESEKRAFFENKNKLIDLNEYLQILEDQLKNPDIDKNEKKNIRTKITNTKKEIERLEAAELYDITGKKLEQLQDENKLLKMTILSLRNESKKKNKGELLTLLDNKKRELENLKEAKKNGTLTLLQRRNYKDLKSNLLNMINGIEKELEEMEDIRKRRTMETCIMCSNVATVASQVYYCSSNCMSEHHSK